MKVRSFGLSAQAFAKYIPWLYLKFEMIFETTNLISKEHVVLYNRLKLLSWKICFISLDHVDIISLSFNSLSHRNICLVNLSLFIFMMRWYCRIMCTRVRYSGKSRSTSLRTPTLHAFLGTPRNALIARRCNLVEESYLLKPVTAPL